MTDFVARLVSRGSVPGDVTSGWGIADYVAGTAAWPAGAFEDIGRLDPQRLRATARALANPPSAELNHERLARLTGIPATTVPPYVEMLVERGVIRLLPGSRASVAKRAIGRPRALFADPALARRLLGVPVGELLEMSGRRHLGPLLFGIAATTLLDQQGTSSVDFRVGHLRERNGLEVDLVVELPDDSVHGIEVRTAAALRPHQLFGLEALAARAGPRFRGGVVLNTAGRGHQYRRGMWGLPLSALWEWDVTRGGA